MMKFNFNYNSKKDDFKSLQHKDGKKFSDLDYMLMLGAFVVDSETNNKKIDYDKYDPQVCHFAKTIYNEYNEQNGDNARELADVIGRSFDLKK